MGALIQPTHGISTGRFQEGNQVGPANLAYSAIQRHDDSRRVALLRVALVPWQGVASVRYRFQERIMMSKIPPPAFRKLRGYATDPSRSTTLSMMQVNKLVYQVAWEELEKRPGDAVASYPIGKYLEIVDYDPASGRFYEPVDLDAPHLLAQEGHAPSVSNPQFHQQMVYAVMMTTIKNFEKALGRKIQWGENIRIPSKSPDGKSRKRVKFEFVQRLRVYPHALRQANAFYDPHKKALLFGYFSASPANAQLQLPGGTVFTCLSHDIIAHETTHAILDGLHRRYIKATHPDTRAFHEAFADIVALLQHFSFPEVLKHQIAQTRGDLHQQNMLGQLAQQFGEATGGYGGLRDAIGDYDHLGNWAPHVPDPDDYQNVMSFHARGGILVAAIFDAFLNIYQHRIRKILRIATGGTGVLPAGELHPDLVDELAGHAANAAREVLRICIRALDYCPPMDITFGDYLRAIITADFDMVADDSLGYRVAFVEAFQKRGISASGIKSMAVEELAHDLNPQNLSGQQDQMGIFVQFLREVKEEIGYHTDRKAIFEATKKFVGGNYGLHARIESKFAHSEVVDEFSSLTGLMFPGDREATEKLGLEFGYGSIQTASYEVGNVWLANRVTPNDGIINHVVVTLIQKRGVRFNVDDGDVTVDEDGFFVPDKVDPDKWGEHHIIFNGGCTLIFDLDTLSLRYSVKKDIDDRQRMIRQYKYEAGLLGDANETYFDSATMTALAGPFAFMHSHTDHD